MLLIRPGEKLGGGGGEVEVGDLFVLSLLIGADCLKGFLAFCPQVSEKNYIFGNLFFSSVFFGLPPTSQINT